MRDSRQFDGTNGVAVKEWFDTLETADWIGELTIGDGTLTIDNSYHPFEVQSGEWIVYTSETQNIEVMTQEAYDALDGGQ